MKDSLMYHRGSAFLASLGGLIFKIFGTLLPTRVGPPSSLILSTPPPPSLFSKFLYPPLNTCHFYLLMTPLTSTHMKQFLRFTKNESMENKKRWCIEVGVSPRNMLMHIVLREWCDPNQVTFLACKLCNCFRGLSLLLSTLKSSIEKVALKNKQPQTEISWTIFRNWNLIHYFSDLSFSWLFCFEIPKVISIVSLIWQINVESRIFDSFYQVFLRSFAKNIGKTAQVKKKL